jgi:hypothetical protein
MWWGGRRSGYFWGFVLVAIGLLALAANLNLLNNLDWNIVWPVILIALGLWFMVVRFIPGGASGAPGSMDSSEAREGLAKAKIEIAIGAGRLNVRGAALGDQLYRTRLDYSGPQPEVSFDRAAGVVRINQTSDWMVGAWRRFDLDLQLNDQLPWEVVWKTGAIRGSLDLSTLPLTRFDCDTGASRFELRLSRPAGEVPIHIAGGALHVDLTRPSGTAARVRVQGGAIKLRADGVTQDGIGSREWQSSGFASSSDRYDASITGGACDVTVAQS